MLCAASSTLAAATNIMDETFSWRGKKSSELDKEELLEVIGYLFNRVKENERMFRKLDLIHTKFK